MSEEEWDAVIAVHLKGHFTLMQPATRHMREKRAGRIITFTSTAGLEGSPGQPNYSAAKEGIVGLTRSAALGMAKYGVTVNCISPTADTRMTQRLPEDRKGQAMAPPEGVAAVVTFLASDRAAHITGQVIGARGNEITLYSHPAPLRQITSREAWTPGSHRRRLRPLARPGSLAAPRRDEDPVAAARAMIRAHLLRWRPRPPALNVERLRLARGLRAPPRSWTLLIALAGFLRQAPTGRARNPRGPITGVEVFCP